MKRGQSLIAGSENLGIWINVVNDGIGVSSHSDHLRGRARPMNGPCRFVPNLPELDAAGGVLDHGRNKILSVLVSARPIRIEIIRRSACGRTVAAVRVVAVGRRPCWCSCHG